jgi:hypothetical protein
MRNLNLNTGNRPTTPNGGTGTLCLSSEASGW